MPAAKCSCRSLRPKRCAAFWDRRCKFSVAGACDLPGTLGGKISIGGYRIAQKIFKFN